MSDPRSKSRSKRVLFTFDSRNLDHLDRLVAQSLFPSRAEAVREAVRVLNALLEQGGQGYTECVVRDPDSREEKVMVFDFMSATRRDAAAHVERNANG